MDAITSQYDGPGDEGEEEAPHETHLEDLTDRIKPRAASNLLLYMILGFFVCFVLWATFAKLDRTIHGQGKVIASSELQVVSNLEGGIVDAIYVHVGQMVKAGDVVMRLSGTQTQAEFSSGTATVDALRMKIARLEAEVAGREPSYPPAVDDSGRTQLEIEKSLHASRMADLISTTGAAEARATQANRAVVEADATIEAKNAARDSAKRQLEMIKPLVDNGIEPRMSLVQQQSQADVASSEAAAAVASAARARGQVAEAAATLAQVRQDWRAKAADELASAQAEMAARAQSLPALADRVARTVVKAPLDGRVNRVLAVTIGGVVKPGEPLLEIVPADKSLLIEAAVKPKDIAFIRLGQRARVNITAYESAIYGSLFGHVVAISPDAVANERTGETHYVVRVRTDSNALKDRVSGQPLPIGPGMIADVNLLGDKRSVMEYILTPLTRLHESAFRE